MSERRFVYLLAFFFGSLVYTNLFWFNFDRSNSEYYITIESLQPTSSEQ